MKKIQRRDVIKCTGLLGVVGCLGVGVSFLAKRSEGKGLLRPPGALEEEDFLASCIKCGQCIQVCPYHSLQFLDMSEGIDMGTPAIDPSKRGCFLCDLLPCVLCCPSGALDDNTRERGDVRMGVAVIKEPEKCWAASQRPVPQGWIDEIVSHGDSTELEKDFNKRLGNKVDVPCDLCVFVCPMEDKSSAIQLIKGRPVFFSACVGCGACQELCPEQLITIKSRKSYEDIYGKDNLRKKEVKK